MCDEETDFTGRRRTEEQVREEFRTKWTKWEVTGVLVRTHGVEGVVGRTEVSVGTASPSNKRKTTLRTYRST